MLSASKGWMREYEDVGHNELKMSWGFSNNKIVEFVSLVRDT